MVALEQFLEEPVELAVEAEEQVPLDKILLVHPKEVLEGQVYQILLLDLQFYMQVVVEELYTMATMV
jgi:hypothetical protein